MIAATRRWFRRNRTNLGIGIGVLGAGYLAGQYVISKISEARERMTSDRVAKENLRRRFQQNQEDCTFTVLGLLPTVAENILDELPVETLTHELQQQRAEKLGRSGTSSEISPSEFSATSPPRNEDGKSVTSSQGDGFLHTSQMASSTTEGEAAPLPKKSKVQLWNELKISSITRAFTLIYTLSLLNLFTRIQLNLLGRRNYLLSVASLTAQSKSSTINLENHEDLQDQNRPFTDFELNRKFLTFSWWLLHRGWRDIMDEVNTAVREVFGEISPREEITSVRMSALVVETRKKMEGQTDDERRNRKWLKYILPPQEQEDFVLQESGVLINPSTQLASPSPLKTSATSSSKTPVEPLRRLLDETADLIESPAATHIVTLLLDAQFSQLTDGALREQAFKLPPQGTGNDPFDPAFARIQEITSEVDPGEAKARLAAILAVITRQAHAIGNGVPNAYVQAMEDVRQLEAFAAVIYSSHFDVEAVAQPDIVDSPPAPVPASQQQQGAGNGSSPLMGMFEGVWQKTVGGR